MSSFIPDPSDNWEKKGSVSQDTWVAYDPYYGHIEHFTEVYRNTDEVQTDTDDWAVNQHGWMSPAADHSWGLDARNYKTEQTQNWGRSDLGATDHLDHTPRKDKKSSFDTTITATYGGGSVSVAYKIPYIKRNVEYEVEKKAKTYYTYPDNIWGHEAMNVDCNQEQIAIWRTDVPSSDNETITTSYYMGKFADEIYTASDYVFADLTLNSIK